MVILYFKNTQNKYQLSTLQKTYLKNTENKGPIMEKIDQASSNQKKAWMVTQAKSIIRNKEICCIMINCFINQKDILILNLCVLHEFSRNLI